MKQKLLLLFGGQSGEHKVSVVSAQSIFSALDQEKYEVRTLGITEEGRWFLDVSPGEWLTADNSRGEGREVTLHLDPACSGFLPLGSSDPAGIYRPDIVFPALHGPKGEDGALQGLLTMAGLPFVGSGVLGGALAMDKDRMKAVFRQEGLPVGDYLVFWASTDAEYICEHVEAELGYPCFVKPANLGSSVGISKAISREILLEALRVAARYDKKLIIERNIDAREVELSVLGNETPKASVPGEIVPAKDFYDYEAKYESEASQLIIPAPLDAKVTATLQDYAVRAFKAVGARGLGRVDFFVTRDSQRIFINEINTMPGFTSISMYPKLWEVSGLPYPELLNRLIELGLE